MVAVFGCAAGLSAACSSADSGPPPAPGEPITEAVQLTVPGLPEPLVTTKPTGSSENHAIEIAVEEFRRASAQPHDDDSEAFVPFEHFVARYPHSGWSAAALTNLGLAYYQAGRFSKAFDAYGKAWTLGRDTTDWKAKAIVDRAVGELDKLQARIGRADALDATFADLKERAVAGSATELLAGAREGLWTMRHEPGFAYLCGPKALKNVLLALGNAPQTTGFLDDERSGPHGYSLARLGTLADRTGIPHRLIHRDPGQLVPIPSVVHWKLNHYAAVVGKVGGRFQIQDPTFGGDLTISPAALDDEASGFFVVLGASSEDARWRNATQKEAETVYGMGFTGSSPAGGSNSSAPTTAPCSGGDGATSGDPAPGDLTSSEVTGPAQCTPCGPDQCGGAPQMTIANAYASTVSLMLTDTPVGYAPQKGPPVFVRVTYNQREDTQPASFGFFNASPKWTINVLSYVVDNPNAPGSSVTRYLPGGGQFSYSGYNGSTGAFTAEMQTGATLTRTPATGTATSYTVTATDGSQVIYATPDGATGYPRRLFVTKVADPQGNQLAFAYDNLLRLTGITDAAGRVTTFSYAFTGTSTQFLLTAVSDPFGRKAQFAYDASGRLASITDVSGIVSSFAYDANSLINALTTPYGTSTFTYGNTGNNGRFLTMTDPLSQTEGLEFLHGGVAGSDPGNTVPSGMTTYNGYLEYRNSYYWDKNSYSQYGTGSGKDYTKAKRWHWLHTAGSQTSTMVESVKRPLENRVWYNSVGQSSNYFEGTSNAISAMGRVLDDGTTQLVKATYNPLGKVTSATDPIGRTTKLSYAPNNVDLVQVQQQLTATPTYAPLASYTYNAQHEPLTVTDAAGQLWQYAYNAAGQLTTVTDPQSHVTTYDYDARGRLSSIVNANNATALTLNYLPNCDTNNPNQVNCDLPQSVTDSEGRTLAYTRDVLDRVTLVTYPDGTTDKSEYTLLDRTSSTDRLGRTTTYSFDANRRLKSVTDPLSHAVQYGYHPNGALHTLTDQNGNVTTWELDLQSRPVTKTYADGKGSIYTYEKTTSRLKSTTDALNQVKTLGYNKDDTLASITYFGALNPTPNVTFAYDPVFPRRVNMTDGNGTTTWSYVPVGTPGALSVLSEDGAFANDAISYGHDMLGRVNSLTVGDTAPETWDFDAIGRPTTHVTGLGTFNYTFLGQTGTPTSRALAGTSINTSWSYDNNSNDRRLLAINNSSGARSFSFGYSIFGSTTGTQNPYDITSISQTAGALPAQSFCYQYDDADRLINVGTPSAVGEGGGGGAGGTAGRDGGGGTGGCTGRKCNSHCDDDDDDDGGDGHDEHGRSGKGHGDHRGSGDGNHHSLLQSVPWSPRSGFEVLFGFNGKDNRDKENNKGSKNGKGDQDCGRGGSAGTAGGGGSNASGSAGAGPTVPTCNGSLYSYALDSADNLTTFTSVTGTTNPTYNNLNQITTNGAQPFAYDLDGNTTSDGDRTYQWDAENRVVEIATASGVTTFKYDGLGRRVQVTFSDPTSTTVRRFTWCEAKICQKRDGADTTLARYFGEGQYNAGGAERWLTTIDQLGSVRDVLDASSGSVISSLDYTPYGQLKASSTEVLPDYRYAGLVADANTGLYYSATRAYDPSTGRWANRDLIEEAGGSNVYSYGSAAPTQAIDTDGTDVTIVIKRDTYTPKSITGTISVTSNVEGAGSFSGFTLENAYPPSKSGLPISPGTYDAFLRPDHTPTRVELMNVIGFTHVQIHNGNYPKDSKACFLVGKNHKRDFVGDSVDALNAVNSVISNDGSGKIRVIVIGSPMAPSDFGDPILFPRTRSTG